VAVDRQIDFAKRHEVIGVGHPLLRGPFFLEIILLAAVAPLSELLTYGNKGYLDEFVWGAIATLQISVCAYAFGISLGLLGAMGKLSGGRFLKRTLDVYTTVFRAVPELVLIMLLYYLGTIGVNNMMVALGFGPVQMNAFAVAVFVLGFVQGAYSTEVLRAAIQAIPIGQSEALCPPCCLMPSRALPICGWPLPRILLWLRWLATLNWPMPPAFHRQAQNIILHFM
jgi:His/Glu/Gln/Arg/opine family amino acid ABC transporter permease subunit